MVDWKSKLTSRKFWTAVTSFVALLVVALGGTQNQATQITAIIMAGATVVAYIVGEGMIDAVSAGAGVTINGNPTITGVGETATGARNGVDTLDGKGTATTDKAAKTGVQAESGAVASDTTGAK